MPKLTTLLLSALVAMVVIFYFRDWVLDSRPSISCQANCDPAQYVTCSQMRDGEGDETTYAHPSNHVDQNTAQTPRQQRFDALTEREGFDTALNKWCGEAREDRV